MADLPIAHRKVIVEPGEVRLLAMDETGQVRSFADARKVAAWIRRRDRDCAGAGQSVTTVVEWRDMPPGFVSPLGEEG